jgi:hypothetical protein
MKSLKEMQNNSEYAPHVDWTSGELGLCSWQGQGFPCVPQLQLGSETSTLKADFLD